MKFNQVQESKQLNSSVEPNFILLTNAIAELEKMLGDEGVSAEEVGTCCQEIEGFANAISAGVRETFEGIGWGDEDDEENF